jgi:hypothetical protein
MSAGQRGGIVAGTWVITLGLVWLVQQALDVPWNEAWPLFLVMSGIGFAVSAIVGLAGRRVSVWLIAWALLWPVTLAGIGLALFVDFAGLADIDAVAFLARWWPVALVVLGGVLLIGAVWPRGRGIEETVSIPAAAGIPGEVVIKFGAGRLDIGPGRTGVLVEGSLGGGGRRRELGPNRIELESDVTQIWPGFGDTIRWRLGLVPDLPLRLRLEGGASRSTLDLTDLLVRELVVKSGASDTRILLPRGVELCSVRVEAGAAQVTIEVPDGVAASIRSSVGLGSTTIAEDRFPRSGDGEWRSPDFDAAPHRAEISVSGGLGSMRIR